jgi:hypothetical protein
MHQEILNGDEHNLVLEDLVEHLWTFRGKAQLFVLFYV